MKEIRKYRYLGDKITDHQFKNCNCVAIVNAKGKCACGKNGNILIQFDNGKKAIVVARLLRKIK
jgi:hypothetical protein